jgi:hypothetical protein
MGTGGDPPPSQALETIRIMDRQWLQERSIELEEAVHWRNAYARVALDNPDNTVAVIRARLFNRAIEILQDQQRLVADSALYDLDARERPVSQ